MTELRVLDLFCGLGGFSAAFREQGHHVVGLDHNADLFDKAVVAPWTETVAADLFEVKPQDLQDTDDPPYDIVLASPPCQTFSVMTINTYWNDDKTPGHGRTFKRIALVRWTLEMIRKLDPRAWIMENPVGMMRTLDCVQPYERRSTSYCRYGMPYRKHTDLWGGWPPGLDLRRPCSPGDKCHQAAPRSVSKHFNGRKDGHDPIRDVWTDLNEKRGGRGPFDTGPAPSDDVEQVPLVKNRGGGAPSVHPSSGFPYEGELRDAWEQQRPGRDMGGETEPPDRKALRSLVPYELSEAICAAVEAWTEAAGRRADWRRHAPKLTDFMEEEP